MYFKQIDKLLTSITDVTKQSQTLMFTKYEDGSMIAYIVSYGKSAIDENELEIVVECCAEQCRKARQVNNQYRLKQLQDEIEKIKLENDFNDDL